jgi:hypothetical protein
LNGRDILTHSGKISHEQTARKAELEFEKFHRAQLAVPSQVEKDFDEAIKKLSGGATPCRSAGFQTCCIADFRVGGAFAFSRGADLRGAHGFRNPQYSHKCPVMAEGEADLILW